MANKKLVLFDFDGVLANTLEYSYQIHKDANPDFSWEVFQSLSDGNFHDGYDNALQDGKHIHPKDFHDQYKNNLDKISIHQALHDSIKILSEKHILIIVSSTRSDFIKDFLEKEETLDFFSEIYGADIHKSKVVKINMILEKYKAPPIDCVFITDTLGDVKEAGECGIRSIGITWGLHSSDHMEKGSPVAIIDDPRDLVSTIENVLK